MKLRRVSLATGAVAVAACGFITAAVALWAANGSVVGAAIQLGTVSFDAFGQSGTTTPQYSVDGGAVTLTLPGTDIVAVTSQTGIDPAPIIWRFTTQGYAQGSAGMDVDVAVTSQVAKDGTVTDLSSGAADQGTLLGFSNMRVYPASVNGDCSAVPDVTLTAGQNIYMVGNTGHVLQAPDAYSGAPVTQVWCVALNFNLAPDGAYANEVQATGTGDDSTVHNAIAAWNAVVAFPPSLNPIGDYTNRADVEATAADATTSRASDLFTAVVYPDPNNEPDVKITIQPKVTSLNQTAA